MRKSIFLIFFIILSIIPSIHNLDQVSADRDPRILELENFLISQFNPEVGLVRESPDETINQAYWLMGDNLLAYHALSDSHPEIAGAIYRTMVRYGYFQDGLHEALFGNEIPLPPYAPQIKLIEERADYTIKTEYRNESGATIMNDWTEYADLVLYATLGYYNAPTHIKQTDKAIYYFNRAKNMWNEAGLYDKPTQQDGYYTTHKLALLLFASLVLNQTLPFRSKLVAAIWRMQREDGGIRTHYLGNFTSNREANTETASLVLIAFNYEEQKLEKIREAEEAEREKLEAEKARIIAEEQRRQRIFYSLAGIFVLNILVLLSIFWKKREDVRNILFNRKRISKR